MQMDQDRSGEIDVNELQSLFDEAGMTVSRSVLDEWIRENDVDGNGKLNFEEFYSFVSSNLWIQLFFTFYICISYENN